VTLLDLAPLAPARADPDDHLEGERAERRPGVDPLHQAQLVGGIEETHQLAAACTLDDARAPEALAREVGLHAGPVSREAEGPRPEQHDVLA
jgi:hypothetical protein